jgi:hypothetical protein
MITGPFVPEKSRPSAKLPQVCFRDKISTHLVATNTHWYRSSRSLRFAFLLVGQSVPNWAIHYCGDFVFSCNILPAIRPEGFLSEISWNFLEFSFLAIRFAKKITESANLVVAPVAHSELLQSPSGNKNPRLCQQPPKSTRPIVRDCFI